jgi:hypothetical protein
MTMIAPHAAASAWMTRTELAQASGLREDLITRFIPGADTPTGPMYAAQQLALAVYVKELTDHNLPPAAVDDKVREFLTRPAVSVPPPIIPKPAARRRGPSAAIGGTAAAALLLGGVIGSIIGAGRTDSSPATAAAPTVTVEAPAPQFNPTIPVTPDPVCAEWGPMADSYNAKLKEWSMKSGDPNMTSSSWTAEQRALNAGAVLVVRDQIADLRRLADQAQDPFLAGLLRAQATYGEAFILRLPNYQPSDRPLWMAAYDFSGAVRAVCKTVQPR